MMDHTTMPFRYLPIISLGSKCRFLHVVKSTLLFLFVFILCMYLDKKSEESRIQVLFVQPIQHRVTSQAFIRNNTMVRGMSSGHDCLRFKMQLHMLLAMQPWVCYYTISVSISQDSHVAQFQGSTTHLGFWFPYLENGGNFQVSLLVVVQI